MDIGTLDAEDPSAVENVLLKALDSGSFGRFKVTKDNFSLRQVSSK